MTARIDLIRNTMVVLGVRTKGGRWLTIEACPKIDLAAPREGLI